MKRRNFIRSSGFLLAASGSSAVLAKVPFREPVPGKMLLNFDAAAGAVPASAVMDEQKKWEKEIRQSSPYHIWNHNRQVLERARDKAADLVGCNADEIAFCRNATEGLDTILRGIDFRAGEEVVYGRYDYPFVQNSIKQLELRNGIRAIDVDYDIANSSDKAIIDAYRKKISKSTRLLVLTHLLNWNGRSMPVKEIIEIARQHDAEVLLDGAQSFAHIPFSLREIRPDYFVACFHKWFRGPLGTAFIFISRARLGSVWPLHGDCEKPPDNIRVFDRLSTLDFPAFLSLDRAFDQKNNPGILQNLARQNELSAAIAGAMQELPQLRPMFSLQKPEYNGILAYELQSADPAAFVKRLLDRHGIIIKTLRYRKLNGFRISLPADTGEKRIFDLIKAIKDEL